MKFLVTGSRNWIDKNMIGERLQRFGYMDILVHGEARGADKLAAEVWYELWGDGYTLPYPANWAQYGKSAGPIRNRQMLSENPDIELVIAFNENISASKGTLNMVEQAIRAGIPIEIIREDTY